MRTTSRKPPASHSDGVITAMTVRKASSDRVAVYLDGAFALELATVLVEQAGLHTGGLLTSQAQDRLVELDAPYRARSRSMRLLALRDHSRREIESRLRTFGFEPEVISDTVIWLQGLGYLDDKRFATSHAARKLNAGWGERRVRAELRRAGVDSVVAEDVLEVEGLNARAAADGADSVLTMARRRFGAQFATDPEAAERRLAGFLVRRGYDWESVGKVTRALRLEASAGSGPGPGLDPGADDGDELGAQHGASSTADSDTEPEW